MDRAIGGQSWGYGYHEPITWEEPIIYQYRGSYGVFHDSRYVPLYFGF